MNQTPPNLLSLNESTIIRIAAKNVFRIILVCYYLQENLEIKLRNNILFSLLLTFDIYLIKFMCKKCNKSIRLIKLFST